MQRIAFWLMVGVLVVAGCFQVVMITQPFWSDCATERKLVTQQAGPIPMQTWLTVCKR